MRWTRSLAEPVRLEELISSVDTGELFDAELSMVTVLVERAIHALRWLEGTPLHAGRCIHRQQTSFSVPIHTECGLRLQHCLEESKAANRSTVWMAENPAGEALAGR